MKYDASDNFLMIVLGVTALAIIATFVAPFLVGVARDMWQWALI